VIAQVNGERKDVTEGTTLGELLRALAIGSVGIAVAVNGRVVPRAGLEHYRLQDGDAVEVVRAVAGG
jgi:sulfur carrier protein